MAGAWRHLNIVAARVARISVSKLTRRKAALRHEEKRDISKKNGESVAYGEMVENMARIEK